MKLAIKGSLILLFSFQSLFSQVDIIPVDSDASVNEVVDIKVKDNFDLSTDGDIMLDNWSTNVFNPYKDEKIEYPFKITFEDSLYRNPVLIKSVVTSRYGWRWGRAHEGIDIDLVTGDDVVSVLDGVVRMARWNGGHGRLVVVRHFNGLETAYAHLSKISVKPNDTVRAGQILGKGGATGNARGSHLHFITSYKGVAINPEYLLDFGEKKRIRASEIWVTRKWTRPFLHSSRRMTKLELLTTEEEAAASLVKKREVYVVKRGDTLSHIARRNGTSIRSICVANNIRSNSVLRVGQRLILEL